MPAIRPAALAAMAVATTMVASTTVASRMHLALLMLLLVRVSGLTAATLVSLRPHPVAGRHFASPHHIIHDGVWNDINFTHNFDMTTGSR